MPIDPRDILRRSDDESGSCDVFVVLDTKEPDAACMARLEKIGLTVERTVGNKLIGSIAADKLDALRECEGVLEVERSRKTRPSDD